MGIKDLLQSVGDAMDENFALCKLAGKRVAIDASSWLHKAIFATAAEYLDLNFEEHMLYVDFIVTRTRNFRLCGVEPVLVFDGKRHHMKVLLDVSTRNLISYVSI
jgi:5'-3' exonuclease